MINFTRHSHCTDCLLCKTARNPGIPTRSLFDNQRIEKSNAILFVGQSPGYNEDQAGKSFVGYTGGLLEKLIAASKLTEYCDIYLANACRCNPPQGANETQYQIRQCRRFLVEDLNLIRSQYDEVIIFALGAKACYSVANISSLSEGFKRQGMNTTLALDGEPTPRVFFTNHPAILHPTRQPAKIHAVEAHFNLLLRYLQGNFIPNKVAVSPIVGLRVPSYISPRLAIDIETYGILAGKEQTVFNPHKSKYIDGIDYPDQIVTISFAWRDSAGDLLTALYRWDNPGDRKIVCQWFRRISGGHHILTGQNIGFDLSYLIASGDKELQYWIQPDKLIIDDTLILSFLHYEQRPEKALKELSVLFGISDYSQMKVTGKSGNAKSSRDKNLHLYNALDGATTLVLAEELVKMITDKYGKDSPKLSSTCLTMRNMVLWDIIELNLNGSSLDWEKLEALHSAEETRCKEIKHYCESVYDLKVSGKGSDAPLREFMDNCIAASGLLGDERVEWTKETRKISIGIENINLVAEHLPESESEKREAILLLKEYKERSKIVSTYTRPMLTQPRKGIVWKRDNIGMVFPSWFPVPLYNQRGGAADEKQKGQIQGRFSCSKPARLTEPQSIRSFSVSRWSNGKLVEYDVNQDHLRMAALLSGDAGLMEAYSSPSESIHTRTARLICPDVNPDSFPSKKEWKNTKEYALGKTLNFLILFKGGAAAFQRTAMHDAGIEISLDFCKNAISNWYMGHPIYQNWQEEQIRLASKWGYLVLPTGWSRTFGPAGTDLSAWEGEVLNFLHQCPCAQITQSAQYQIQTTLRRNYLHSKVCLEIYDAIFVDVFEGEEETVDEIVKDAMTHPPVLAVFEKWVGRTIPWLYEKKEYAYGQ